MNEDSGNINGKPTINLPPPNTFAKFKSYHKKLIAPFVFFYADFESIIIPCEEQHKDKAMNYTCETQKLKICSHEYRVVCKYDDKYTKIVKIYRGENAVINL